MKTYEDADLDDNLELYDPEDHDTHRNLIFNDVQKSFEGLFPRVQNGKRVEVTNLHYKDPERYSLAQQHKALVNDEFLHRRLAGTMVLKDDTTGKVLDKKDMTFMKVPYLTDRGTFIREGNEWALTTQQRLMPGAYSRIQANGELKTQFNVRAGTGGAFDVTLNPESSQMRMRIKGGDIHLYSLLKDLGVPDKKLEKSWGKEVLDANASKYDARTFEKAYTKIVPEWDRKNNPDRSRAEKAKLIQDALERSQVSTNVLKSTLPNFFSREKAASWNEQYAYLTKQANLTKSDLQEIIAFINAESDINIPLELPKTQLEEAIKMALRSDKISAGGRATDMMRMKTLLTTPTPYVY